MLGLVPKFGCWVHFLSGPTPLSGPVCSTCIDKITKPSQYIHLILYTVHSFFCNIYILSLERKKKDLSRHEREKDKKERESNGISEKMSWIQKRIVCPKSKRDNLSIHIVRASEWLGLKWKEMWQEENDHKSLESALDLHLETLYTDSGEQPSFHFNFWMTASLIILAIAKTWGHQLHQSHLRVVGLGSHPSTSCEEPYWSRFQLSTQGVLRVGHGWVSFFLIPNESLIAIAFNRTASSLSGVGEGPCLWDSCSGMQADIWFFNYSDLKFILDYDT